MAELYSQYASGIQLTAGTIAGSALGVSGLNPIVDRLNSISDTDSTILPAVTTPITPIGAVIAWLKSFTNTPNLPDGWVECDGSVLSDADSVYNGQTLPDLNGGEFLEGRATSGDTGGSATMSHSHNIVLEALGGPDNESRSAIDGIDNFSTAAASNTENRPPYYNVVWIMRIK